MADIVLPSDLARRVLDLADRVGVSVETILRWAIADQEDLADQFQRADVERLERMAL